MVCICVYVCLCSLVSDVCMCMSVCVYECLSEWCVHACACKAVGKANTIQRSRVRSL